MPDSILVDPGLRPAVPAAPALPQRFLEPPGFVWGRFRAPDGTILRWGRLAAAQPRGEIVMVCGFTEPIEKYFETIADLVARDLSVWCLDWRGQGGSERPKRLPSRPRRRNFDRDATDLAAFVAALPRHGVPRVLLAHSMGGAIGLLCMHRAPGLFGAAILSAPMLGIRTAPVPLPAARVITGAVRLSGLGFCFLPGARPWQADRIPSPERSRVSGDVERCRLQYEWFLARPELRVDQPTYGWLDAALRLVQRIGRAEFLAGIATPVLIASPGLDRIVPGEAHRRAASLLPDCTLIELPESKHEPFLETDPIRDRWLAAIDRFLDGRFNDGNGGCR